MQCLKAQCPRSFKLYYIANDVNDKTVIVLFNVLKQPGYAGKLRQVLVKPCNNCTSNAYVILLENAKDTDLYL